MRSSSRIGSSEALSYHNSIATKVDGNSRSNILSIQNLVSNNPSSSSSEDEEVATSIRDSNIHHGHHQRTIIRPRTQAGLTSPLVIRLLLAGICLLLGNIALSTSSPSQPIVAYSPNYPPLQVSAGVGPSLCPLVAQCQCKWSNGKQGKSSADQPPFSCPI